MRFYRNFKQCFVRRETQNFKEVQKIKMGMPLNEHLLEVLRLKFPFVEVLLKMIRPLKMLHQLFKMVYHSTRKSELYQCS